MTVILDARGFRRLWRLIYMDGRQAAFFYFFPFTNEDFHYKIRQFVGIKNKIPTMLDFIE